MTETSQNLKSKQHFYSDVSFWSLLIANIITTVWALKEGWSLELMIWVYFSQNLILGVFWPAKVFASSLDSSYTKKIQSVAIFVPHYLILHLLYANSLYNYFSKELPVNFKPIIIVAGIFFISETFSYFAENNINRHISLAKAQLFPYARVIPMHFVMLIGLFAKTENANAHFSIIIFLLLKTFADVAMYMVERSSLFAGFVTDSFAKYEERSRRLGNLVTDAVAKLERPFLTGYSNSKQEQDLCRFCQRIISKNETSYVIKEHVVCKECYDRIEKEKEKTS